MATGKTIKVIGQFSGGEFRSLKGGQKYSLDAASQKIASKFHTGKPTKVDIELIPNSMGKGDSVKQTTYKIGKYKIL